MVKIPELAKDGQNWKIYRTKFLEVAATFDCLEVLAGRPYKGDDWDGCNALLCCMFMETVAPSICFKIHCRTAHKIFKYLVKCFHDNDPIPCANELQCASTAAAVETPEKSPMSANATTEWHAHTNLDEEDLSNSKALTRGTEDINNGNIRCTQDPHTSSEDSAKGTSAECAEMTTVVLESVLHETQDQLQNSLQTTLRLPTEGEPSKCRQEAVDSVVTATCMNGMAKPTDMDVDSEKAPLGGDPAERACRVNEGVEMEREAQSQLQELKLLCGEINQCSGIANGDVPITNGLLLEGEWTAYPSGETTDLKGVELEGCEGSMDKLTELLMMSVEPYVEDSGDIPCMYLGGTKMWTGNVNSPGN